MEDLKLLRSHKTWGRFLLLFLPFLGLTSISAWYVYSSEAQTRQKLFHQQEETCVENHQHKILDTIRSVKSDLLFLSMLEEFRVTTSNMSKSRRDSVAKEFVAFAFSKKEYDQIRYIDSEGMEVVRVNYNDGSPEIVLPHKLQSKANRYYVTDSLHLDRGEVYMSPFDLNIEHGRIEIPFKPVLRFTTPLFNDQGRRIGLIVLNYLGQAILENFTQELHCDHGCQLMLLNRDGFWLKGPVVEDEWAFMFEDNKERSFARYFPDEWQKISTGGEGHFISKSGYYTYSTIYPLADNDVSSSGSSDPFQKSKKSLSGDDYYWKLVSIVPLGIIAVPNSFTTKLFSGYLAVSLIFATITFLLAYTQTKRSELETSLENIFNTSIPICITNDKYQIVLSNDSYKEIFKDNELSEPGLKCYESRPGPACQTEKCPLQRILRGEKDVACEPTKIDEDGNKQYFLVTAQPYLNRKGDVVGVVECFMDITARKNAELERDKLVEELQGALSKVKLLSGFLPICASCKKIRDDKGYWNQIESYIRSRSEAEFSHGICPDCVEKLYPGLLDK